MLVVCSFGLVGTSVSIALPDPFDADPQSITYNTKEASSLEK